jgi:HTH-type transcriptional regulator / antitoxin HigA
MSVAAMDYRTLVADTQPRVIHDEVTNEKFVAVLENLDRRWEGLNPSERELHELLIVLIEHYEKKHYELRRNTAIEAISELMLANELKQKDLVGSVFETTSVVSEVLSGKRPLTVDHIRRLCHRFNVTADVFI